MKRISALILIVLGVFLLCSCEDKDVLTSEQFTKYFEEKGFAAFDITDMENAKSDSSFKEETGGNAFNKYLVVRNENYQVEFVEFSDESYAFGTFENMKANYSIKMFSKEVSSGNYATTSFTSDGKYVMMTAVDNTLLYCEAPEQFKEEVSSHFEALGYK